jgi:hypothetical protein
MPGRRFQNIKTMLEMGNEWHCGGGRRGKITNALGQDAIIDAGALGRRRHVEVQDFG